MSRIQESVGEALRLDGSKEKITEYYARWASGYDRDLARENYRSPAVVAGLLAETAAAPGGPDLRTARILDAGCGTGLVGTVLTRDLGVRVLDGFDLSEEMVAEARRTGAYRSLTGGVDMNRGLTEYATGAYDATVCAGVFTLGHVPPEGLDGLLRVTASGGLVAVSTRRSYTTGSGWENHVARLADAGALRVVKRLDNQEYTADEPGDYWVFEVTR